MSGAAVREQLEKELAHAPAQLLLINPHPFLPACSASNVLGLVHAATALQRRTAAAAASTQDAAEAASAGD